MQHVEREFVVRIGDDPPARLDSALAKYAPDHALLTRTRAAKLIKAGAVSRNGVVVRGASAAAAFGDELTIVMPDDGPRSDIAEDLPLEIVFEDWDIVVVNKQPGLVVHPAKGNRSGTLVNAMLHHCSGSLPTSGDSKHPGIVHRLDKDTSGLLVVAKSELAMARLSAQFMERSVDRCYLALAKGVPGKKGSTSDLASVQFEDGGVIRIDGPIGRHPTNRLKQAIVAGGRRAVTRIRVIAPLAEGHASLVECRLETGRTHQIRVHMERMGHPLVGDPLYGGGVRLFPASLDADMRAAAESFPRQALHAASLGVTHPRTGQRMQFDSDLPPDMRELHKALSSGKR